MNLCPQQIYIRAHLNVLRHHFKCSLFSPPRFSASKSMVHWINLSLLYAALTRQSPRVTADWICVIKDDKQNHLLVISICHRSVFAISGASLKNNSGSWMEGGGGLRTPRWLRHGGRGGETGARVKGSVWMWMSGYTIKMKEVKGGERPSLSRPSSHRLFWCPVSSNKQLHQLPFFSLGLGVGNASALGEKQPVMHLAHRSDI